MPAYPPDCVSTAALAAAFCLAGGTAAYASGLPQQASDTAAHMLQQLGITTGAGNGHAKSGHGLAVTAVAHDGSLQGAAKGAAVSAVASGGRSRAGDGSDAGATGSQDTGKGSDTSGLATTTTDTGRDKGASISTTASGGSSQVGTHGARVAGGGACRCAQRWAGSGGADTADTASGGRSSADSDHAAH